MSTTGSIVVTCRPPSMRPPFDPGESSVCREEPRVKRRDLRPVPFCRSWRNLHDLPGGPMLFKKLFQLLVVGGAVLGGTSGCSTASSSQQGSDKTVSGTGASAAGGASAASSDADAGVKTEKAGGVSGWSANP